jgi:hypothetical protein
MDARKKLEQKIRSKEDEIQELETKLAESRVYLSALQDCLKVFPKDDNGSIESVELRPGSKTAKARDAIKAAGRALHITEIVSELGIENTKENRASLSGSIQQYVRKNQVFRRAGPNTFGLIELNGNHADSEELPFVIITEEDGQE